MSVIHKCHTHTCHAQHHRDLRGDSCSNFGATKVKLVYRALTFDTKLGFAFVVREGASTSLKQTVIKTSMVFNRSYARGVRLVLMMVVALVAVFAVSAFAGAGKQVHFAGSYFCVYSP